MLQLQPGSDFQQSVRRFLTSGLGITLLILLGLPVLYVAGRLVLICAVQPYIVKRAVGTAQALCLPDTVVDAIRFPASYLFAAGFGLPMLLRLFCLLTGFWSWKLPRSYLVTVVLTPILLAALPDAIYFVRGVDASGQPRTLLQVDPFNVRWFDADGDARIYVSQETGGTFRFWNRKQAYTEDSRRVILPVNESLRETWESLSTEEKEKSRPAGWNPFKPKTASAATPTPTPQPVFNPKDRLEHTNVTTPFFQPEAFPSTTPERRYRPTPTPKPEPEPEPAKEIVAAPRDEPQRRQRRHGMVKDAWGNWVSLDDLKKAEEAQSQQVARATRRPVYRGRIVKPQQHIHINNSRQGGYTEMRLMGVPIYRWPNSSSNYRPRQNDGYRSDRRRASRP